jgi:nucleotide-binding universal stress UspA family protein
MRESLRNECTADKPKLLVLINDDWNIDRLFSWLANKQYLWTAEILLLKILRPNWFDDTPYTSSQALRLLDEQEDAEAQAWRDLSSSSRKIRLQYPEISLFTHVRSGHSNAETVTKVAKEFEADSIVLFCGKKNPISTFLEKRFCSQISSSASCHVYIIDPQFTELRSPAEANCVKSI